jgi:acylphosphatase
LKAGFLLFSSNENYLSNMLQWQLMENDPQNKNSRDPEKRRITAVVTGRVQMVMFRDFVRRNASGLGLVGTVENKRDGSVQVVVEGEAEKLKQLVEKLYVGPPAAKVEDVGVEWSEGKDEFENFQIIY